MSHDGPVPASTAEGVAESTADNLRRLQVEEVVTKVEQANRFARDLKRSVIFEPSIVTHHLTGETFVMVAVEFPSVSLTWPKSKFDARFKDMTRWWETWRQAADKDGEEVALPEDETDPFMDYDEQLIGMADVWLMPLSNMNALEVTTPVISIRAVKEGDLSVRIVPLDANGEEGPWDDEALDPFVEDPNALLNTEIGFVVKVDQLVLNTNSRGQASYRDTRIRYSLNDGTPEELTRTVQDAASAGCTTYQHAKRFHKLVDLDFLRYLTTGRITFEVWGELASCQ